jgi:hydroxymethylglutaryl-CoA lyase
VSKKIRIFEVGPRDGLQNTKNTVSVEKKISLIDLLSQTGVDKIECGSFVSEKWVPQMTGSAQVLQNIKRVKGVSYTALTPNIRGFDQAISVNCDEVAIFASASEIFSLKNINCSIADSIERFRPLVKNAKERGIPVRGYVSCVIECPYEGKIQPVQVLEVCQKLLGLGVYEISLGDTIGKGTPRTVRALLKELCGEISPTNLAGHFHDTNNNAIENVGEAIMHDIKTFDSAIGGLGGCPYAPGAKGNLSTKNLIKEVGVENFCVSINIEKILEAEQLISNIDY